MKDAGRFHYLRQEVMFSSDLFIYLFIYLFVSKIAQKLTSGFGWNFVGKLALGQEGTD